MRKKLNKKLCMDDIYEICILCHGNSRKKAELYQLIFDEDERVATNALWYSLISTCRTTSGSMLSMMT